MAVANAQPPFDCGASANPTTGQAPLTVQFTATPSGGVLPYSFQWTFGDGEQSIDQNPSHTYQKPGTYGWSLNAQDSSGQLVIAAGTIIITAGQWAAVGGHLMLVDKFAILAPYLALLGLIGVVISIVAVWKKRRN